MPSFSTEQSKLRANNRRFFAVDAWHFFYKLAVKSNADPPPKQVVHGTQKWNLPPIVV